MSGSQQRTFIDPTQTPFLADLYGAGRELAFAQLDTLPGVANQLAGRLGGQGERFLGNIEDAAAGNADPIIQALMASSGATPGAGLDFQALLEPGEALGGQLDLLGDSLSRNLDRMLGTLGEGSTLVGGSGGDREAYFARELAGDTQREFAGQASNLLSSDLATRRALATDIAGFELSRELGTRELSNAALAAAGDLSVADRATTASIAGSGIDRLAPLFNLGLSPYSAGMQPLLALREILGPATVLSEGSSRAAGFSRGEQRSESRSRGESRGDQSSIGFSVTRPGP